MWKVYALMFIVVAIVSALWVSGIDYMQKNHPDYKGEDSIGGFDFDDEKDEQWGDYAEVNDDEEIKPVKKIEKNIKKD